jgi:hypothetical protein
MRSVTGSSVKQWGQNFECAESANHEGEKNVNTVMDIDYRLWFRSNHFRHVR